MSFYISRPFRDDQALRLRMSREAARLFGGFPDDPKVQAFVLWLSLLDPDRQAYVNANGIDAFVRATFEAAYANFASSAATASALAEFPLD